MECLSTSVGIYGVTPTLSFSLFLCDVMMNKTYVRTWARARALTHQNASESASGGARACVLCVCRRIERRHASWRASSLSPSTAAAVRRKRRPRGHRLHMPSSRNTDALTHHKTLSRAHIAAASIVLCRMLSVESIKCVLCAHIAVLPNSQPYPHTVYVLCVCVLCSIVETTTISQSQSACCTCAPGAYVHCCCCCCLFDIINFNHGGGDGGFPGVAVVAHSVTTKESSAEHRVCRVCNSLRTKSAARVCERCLCVSVRGMNRSKNQLI